MRTLLLSKIAILALFSISLSETKAAQGQDFDPKFGSPPSEYPNVHQKKSFKERMAAKRARMKERIAAKRARMKERMSNRFERAKDRVIDKIEAKTRQFEGG